MIADNVSTKNRRGRPATGANPVTGVRLPPELIKALDQWRRDQPDLPGRPEAIRRLIETGLGKAVAVSSGSGSGSARKPASPGKSAPSRARKPAPKAKA